MFEDMRAWSEWLEATDHRPKTVREYRYWLIRFSADTLCCIAESTEDDLVSYLAALPRQGMSRQMFLRSMRSYWSWASPAAGRNPAERLHVRRPKDPPAPCLGPSDVRRLIRGAFRREVRRGWGILLCACTGLRVASLVALRPEDVVEGVAWLKEAKGGRSYEAPLRRAARLAVRHLAEEGYPTLLGVGAEGFRRWLRQAAVDAGIETRVYPHLLRHSLATAVGRQTDPETWRVVMGHADLSQWSRYVHTDRARVLEALEGAKIF
jgi:integrase/recombinase XerD